MRRSSEGFRFIVLLVLVCIATQGSWSEGEVDEERHDPIALGLELDTSVSISLFDVLVTDRLGNPMPGLARDDFEVKLGGGWQRPYSVDDLCPCGGDPSKQMRIRLERAGLDSRIYVLYFDFGQLQQSGRTVALEQATRWVDQTMTDDDRAMIVAVSPRNLIREVTALTSDRQLLLEGLARIANDPDSLATTASDVDRSPGCIDCGTRPGRYYADTRRSLRTLLFFVSGLEDIEGRKALLLFHQNLVIDPNPLFPLTVSNSTWGLLGTGPLRSPALTNFIISPMPGPALVHAGVPSVGSSRVPDHLGLVEEIGGTAVAAHTAIFPMFCGDRDLDSYGLSTGAVNFGANLADFTGGGYNHGNSDLAVKLDEAERGCRCLYRIGVMPARNMRPGTHRLKVHVPGARIGGHYRVRLYSEQDRWLRRARSTLKHPETARQIPLSGAIIPVAVDGNRWTVRVEVAFDLSFVDTLPKGNRPQGQWAVGAVLFDVERNKDREMLGWANLWTGTGGQADAVIVHDRTFEKLLPGRYELRAFVRDEWAQMMGGAKATITLPRPSRGGIVGPVRMQSVDDRIRMNLPGHSKKARRAARKNRLSATGPTPVETAGGVVPSDGDVVTRGDRLVFESWVCNPSSEDAMPIVRFLTRNGQGLLRYPDSSGVPPSACRELRDPVNTGDLEWGTYGYHIQQVDDADTPLYGSQVFTVIERVPIASADSSAVGP